MPLLSSLSRSKNNAPATMSGKQASLKMRLVRGFLSAALVLSILGLIFWSTTTLEQSRTTRFNELNDQLTKLNGDITALQTKLSKAETMLPQYNALVKTQKGAQIPLDRQHAQDIFTTVQKEFLFSTMQAGIPMVQDMKDPYKNEFVAGIQCPISLSVNALSDEHVIRFLHALRNQLPGGALRISNLTLSRTAEYTSRVPLDVARTGKVALVKSEVKMTWMGMKDLQPASSAPPSAANTAAPSPAAPGGVQ